MAESRQAAQDAVTVLDQVLRQDTEVDALSAKSERIHRENNLGPKFWNAVENMMGRHA